MKAFLFVLVLFFLSGCNFPQKGIIEPGVPPFISQASISPNLLNVGAIAQLPTDPVDTLIKCTATTSNSDNTTQVSFSLLDPNGVPFMTGTMHDDGVSPDLTAGDGVFSGEFRFHIRKEDIGAYGMQFQATGGSGFRSNTLLQSLLVRNSNNHRPTISNPVVPDSVTVPVSSGTALVVVSITVTDQEGLGDIASVSFTSRRPDGSIVGVYPLYDDGGHNPQPPFALNSGDAVAGDGIYTLTVPLPNTTDRNTYRDFSFIATDRSGEFSDVLTKRIFIR